MDAMQDEASRHEPKENIGHVSFTTMPDPNATKRTDIEVLSHGISCAFGTVHFAIQKEMSSLHEMHLSNGLTWGQLVDLAHYLEGNGWLFKGYTVKESTMYYLGTGVQAAKA